MMAPRATVCLFLLASFSGARSQSGAEWLPAQRRQRCPILPTVPSFNLRDVSALGVAVLFNATDDIQGLVQAGCDVNYDGAYNVHTSTECESPLLTRLGINCTREVKVSGYTPLAIAMIVGSTPTLKKLVSLPGIDLDTKTADINPAVYDAARAGNLEALVILGEAGANLNANSSENGFTPLSSAAYRNEREIVRYLLSKGVKIDQEDNNGGTAAFAAALAGNLDILKLLSAEGANLDAVGTTNQISALSVAADGGHTDVVEFLISKRVDLNKQGLDGDNAVFMAARQGKFEAVQALAAAGANLDLPGTVNYRSPGRSPFKSLPLEAAILFRNTKIALFLIKNGANINLRDSDGDTFAFLAAYVGDLEVVKALREAGADFNTAGVTGSRRSPVAAAAIRGNVEVVEFLVSRGVDLTARDADGKTILILRATSLWGGEVALSNTQSTSVGVGAVAFESAMKPGQPIEAPASAATAADHITSNETDPVANEPTAKSNPEDVSNDMAEKPVLTNKPAKSLTDEVEAETTVNGKVP